MAEARWYEVDLDTLSLRPFKARRWPESMEPFSSRMCEECLESLVALNLSSLFPDEHLLLTAVQEQMTPAADVVAVDPLGIVRLIELKKTAVARGELESQVVSYGINRTDLRGWSHELACRVTDLPETLSLMIEAFRWNIRAKALARDWFEEQLPSAHFKGANRFDRISMKVAALRSSRRAKPPIKALNDPAVEEISGRLYGTGVLDLAWTEPQEIAAAIVTKHFHVTPPAGFTEFTIVAPGLGQDAEAKAEAKTAASPLEKRRACFNLIDGDLRCVMDDNAVHRAVLRWEPVHRTICTRTLLALIALRTHLAAAGQSAAAGFIWDPSRHWIYWPHLRGPYLYVTEEADGMIWIETWAEWVTEGLADLKERRKQSQVELGKKLASKGIEHDGKELCAPLSGKDISAAVTLVGEYHDLVTELGFGDWFRWHRRPQAAESRSGKIIP